MISQSEARKVAMTLARWLDTQGLTVGDGAAVTAMLLGVIMGSSAKDATELEHRIGSVVAIMKPVALETMSNKQTAGGGH